jgi:hypothetical protein
MKKLLLLVASLLVMWANSAGATIILINPPARVPDAGTFLWTYAAVLQPDQNMRAGDFFTLYDFPFADTLSSPQFGVTGADDNALFAVSVQNVGIDPPSTHFPDVANVTNVTVTLVDADTTTPGIQNIIPAANGGQVQLGTLIIRSTTRAIANSNFGALAQGKLSGNGISNGGPINVAAIPEPGSITLLLAGLVACGAISYRRRRMVD